MWMQMYCICFYLSKLLQTLTAGCLNVKTTHKVRPLRTYPISHFAHSDVSVYDLDSILTGEMFKRVVFEVLA